MATLGDLVVNLTANSSNFKRTMAESQAITRQFGQSSARASGTAATGFERANVSVLKMAAGFVAVQAAASAFRATISGLVGIVRTSIQAAVNVETLATQFEVLTGSAEDAQRVLGDISTLAAETPFQKSELADAGRMLMAFGTASGDVATELRRIGDIAALTGNSIGDIAEIYGKARVQGRLFAEDINQLTGRGIPIIQELAKQFGVTDAEVKQLVADGEVGFANIQQAFIDMTSGAGKFAGGMEKLSQTTAGKWSTMKDKLTEIAATIGEQLLPAVNKLVDALSEMFAEGSPAMEGLNSAISGFETLSSAMSAWEGGLGLGAGINLNAIQENELNRIEQQNKRAVDNARRKFEQPKQQEQPAVAKQPMVIPGDVPQAAIGAVEAAIEQAIPSAIVDGFHDAGRLIPEPETQRESAARFAGAAEAGSAEAFSSIVRNVFGGRSPQKMQLDESKRTNKLLEDTNGLIERSFFNTATVESFA